MRQSLTASIVLALAGAVLSSGHMQTPTIRTDVNLVQVQAKVTDDSGRIVTDLEKSAFELLVDGVKQDITVFQGEDAPVTAGIVIDNSASMAPKRQDVIQAATDFARDSNPRDEMFVVHFSDHARFALPESKPFTDNLEELEAAISRFHLGGTTAFYDALTQAMGQFHRAAYNRRVILAITDGGDNSSTAEPKDVLTTAAKTGTVIYAVGMFDITDRDRNPAILKQFAEATGGQAFFPDSSAEIPGICREIAKEIRHQYTLGFPGAADGRYHQIRLLVHDPRYGKLLAHTRSGYLAVKPGT